MSPKLRMRTTPHRGGGGRGGGGAVTSDSHRQGWRVGAPHFLQAVLGPGERQGVQPGPWALGMGQGCGEKAGREVKIPQEQGRPLGAGVFCF